MGAVWWKPQEEQSVPRGVRKASGLNWILELTEAMEVEVKPCICDADKLSQVEREERERNQPFTSESWRTLDDPLSLEERSKPAAR